MNDNLRIYNSVRTPPPEALKPITAGRLKGKSDINPMWRIKALTEQFGAAGFGWYYTIENQWLEPGADGEIAAFCMIALYIKQGDEWSKPIFGVGGSMLAEKESRGLHTNDECYKMALTDAISVACKALGFAADVYWDKDSSKYNAYHQADRQAPSPRQAPAPRQPQQPQGQQPRQLICADCGRNITGTQLPDGRLMSPEEIYDKSMRQYHTGLCADCQRKRKENRNNA